MAFLRGLATFSSVTVAISLIGTFFTTTKITGVRGSDGESRRRLLEQRDWVLDRDHVGRACLCANASLHCTTGPPEEMRQIGAQPEISKQHAIRANFLRYGEVNNP
jgi:hypothetical protein